MNAASNDIKEWKVWSIQLIKLVDFGCEAKIALDWNMQCEVTWVFYDCQFTNYYDIVLVKFLTSYDSFF